MQSQFFIAILIALAGVLYVYVARSLYITFERSSAPAYTTKKQVARFIIWGFLSLFWPLLAIASQLYRLGAKLTK